MRLWLFRHVVLVITLGAFLSAGLMQAAWPVQAAASPNMTMIADTGSNAPMPCKGTTPACMTDLGCIFMIGMPIDRHADHVADTVDDSSILVARELRRACPIG